MKPTLMKDAIIALGCALVIAVIYFIVAKLANVPGAVEDSSELAAVIATITFAVRRIRARARN